MYWRPRITTTDPVTDIQYRLSDDRNRQWFSHYGPDGSGFGYLTWRCHRPIGFDYPDLGYAYPVTMRKGPFRVLFDGQIVRMFERSGQQGSEIEVWALGWAHAAGADVYNRVYCDTRWTRWSGAETLSGAFHPEAFDWSTAEALYFKPRRGIDFVDYAEVASYNGGTKTVVFETAHYLSVSDSVTFYESDQKTLRGTDTVATVEDSTTITLTAGIASLAAGDWVSTYITGGWYTYLRYTFQFDEVATRIVADYEVELPGAWPGKLEVRDSNGNVLWSEDATGTGSIDETTSGSPTYFEVRFYTTAAGENTAADGTVYGQLTDVKVYSVNETTLDAKVVADDLVNERLSLAGHGLSDRVDDIDSPGLALEPSAFDTDMTPAQILSWCCKFGDANGDPLAWGVTMDDRARLFLETQDLTTIQYVVKPWRANLERGGDWGESAQVAYGVYTDDSGQIQRTADQTQSAVIAELGGYYRRRALQISGATDSTIVSDMVDLWLDENERPVVSGSFVVRGGVRTPAGLFVPYDEVVPGGLVQVSEWRAVEATLSADDYRDKTTTFQLAGVRVNEDERTVELVPRQSSDAFERYMAILQELAG